MSERRPHWTDDLIEAVYAELPAKKYQVEPDSWEVHRIIAAVEDWARWEHVPKGTLARMDQAEAAIARVRDVCDRIWDDARYAHKYGFLEVVREVRYALEGDSEQ